MPDLHTAYSPAWFISLDALCPEALRKLEAFHMHCQRMVLEICWYDFVRNTEVIISTTNLCSAQDIITRGKNHRPVILRLIVHCPRSQRLELVPALTPAGADAQATHLTRGYSRSVMVPLLASMLNGPSREHSRLTQRTSSIYAIRWRWTLTVWVNFVV